MTAPITLTPGMFAPSLRLWNDSALKDCTSVLGDLDVVVERNWPTLSSGEELLWSLLAWLNGQGQRPSDAALAAGLDAPNVAAAQVAIWAGSGAVA